MKAEEKRKAEVIRLEDYRSGKDEMNLADFALSGISARRVDGKKTVIHRGRIFDPETKKLVPSELAISGGGQFGLPTAVDEDVLLACLQLSRLKNFRSHELYFTRYEVLKLLKWSDESHYYRRVKVSLRRWMGLTVYSDRCFFDHVTKGFVDRDISIIQHLEFFDREKADGTGRHSLLVWSDFLWRNCEAGYIKDLDWQFYIGLSSPVAKRLYRFLDKRFWQDKARFVFDLRELAVKHIGISSDRENYDIIRELKKGIAELEAKWQLLLPLEGDRRFRRVSHGKWEVEFTPRIPAKGRRQRKVREKGSELFEKLCSRGVNVEGAKRLVRTEPAEKINKQIEAFDFRMRNPKEGRSIQSPGGFLATAIREEYEPPTGFVSKDKQQARKESMKAGDLELAKRRQELEAKLDAKDSAAERAVDEFLSSLPSDEERAAFELASVNASPFLKHYEEAKEDGGPRFERWRRLILRQAVKTAKGRNDDGSKLLFATSSKGV